MSRQQKWNERYTKKDLIWSAAPNHVFVREVEDLKPGKALDVACGEGRNALWLVEQDWDVTGIDFSDVAIVKAEQIAAKRSVNVNWIAANVSTMQLPQHEYDLAAVLYLHTPPEERERWMANVTNSIKPGGSFIYIAHDTSNLEHGVGGPQDLALLPSLEEITGALTGFEIQRAEVVYRPVENDPGHGQDLEGVALDSIIRAVKNSPGPGNK